MSSSVSLFCSWQCKLYTYFSLNIGLLLRITTKNSRPIILNCPSWSGRPAPLSLRFGPDTVNFVNFPISSLLFRDNRSSDVADSSWLLSIDLPIQKFLLFFFQIFVVWVIFFLYFNENYFAEYLRLEFFLIGIGLCINTFLSRAF